MNPAEISPNDPDLLAANTELQAAQERGQQKETLAHFGGVTDTMPGEHDPISPWLRSLPKNVSVGLIDAAVNTADAIGSATNAIADKAGIPETPKGNTVDKAYLLARDHVLNFRDALATDSSSSDEMTQAIAQYAIPFLGWMKLMGGLKGTGVLGAVGKTAAAETLTAGTVLKPHDARMADVVALGKHVESRFGKAMNTLSPDGSLMNSYINWMTDRSNEGEWEGRFKNVVDNLAVSAAGAALVQASAAALKGTWAVGKYGIENVGKAPVGLSAQKGVLGVANNASVESPASLEAINRVAEEKVLGRVRMVIDRDGTVRPLLGVDAVDAAAKEGQIIVQRNIGEHEWTPLSKGKGVADTQVKGILNASKSKLDEAMKAGAK